MHMYMQAVYVYTRVLLCVCRSTRATAVRGTGDIGLHPPHPSRDLRRRRLRRSAGSGPSLRVRRGDITGFARHASLIGMVVHVLAALKHVEISLIHVFY